MMPLVFNAAECNGLETVYQFRISGEENFTAHLKIRQGQCGYHDGPADTRGVINKPRPLSGWQYLEASWMDSRLL